MLERRDDRFLRDLIESAVWPVIAMLLLTAATELLLQWTPSLYVASDRVMPILGFFLAYRLLGVVIGETFAQSDAQRRVRRGILPLFFVLAALQQLGLLNQIVNWMRDTGFSLGTYSISLFAILSAIGAVIAFSLGGRAAASVVSSRILPQVGVDNALSDVVGAMVRYVLVVVGLMVGLHTLGVDLSTLQIALGALGVGIGFGLQNIVNNFISGLILLFERSVKRGDILNAAGTDGRVQLIGLRSSVLRTRQGDDIIVPNSLLVSERVTNYSFGDRLKRLDVQISVGFESDPRATEAVLLESARENKNVLTHPEPSVLFVQFGESAIVFELRVWLADAWILPQVRSALLFDIWYRLKAAGIAIPYPQRDVHLKSGWVEQGRAPS
jgi:small-conductance mechanosensitive channel